MAERIDATPVRYPFSFVIAGDSGAWADPTADAIYRQLLHDAAIMGPGGQTGTALESSVADLEPQRPALRKNHSRTRLNATTARTRAP